MKLLKLISKTNAPIIIQEVYDERCDVLFVGKKGNIPFDLLRSEVVDFSCSPGGYIEVNVI